MKFLIPFLFLHSLSAQFCFEPNRKNCPENFLKNSTENEGKSNFFNRIFENFEKPEVLTETLVGQYSRSAAFFGSFCNN